MSLEVENEMPELDELSEVDSLRSDNDDDLYGDSEDDYVPPPPPLEENISLEKEDQTSGETEDEYNDDGDDEDEINSLASTNDQNQLLASSSVYENEEDEDEDDDEDDDNYLQKFEDLNKKDLIASYHPELITHNNDEVETLTRIIRNEQGIIVDPIHKTLPFLTKYEKARILGERAKQLNMGAKPLVELGPDVIDGYLIALREFDEKKIPFIIKRPMPNGGCEYWKCKDLETI
jgi:DNA-directed RNA polymerase I, II, and III subunit RPABC2